MIGGKVFRGGTDPDCIGRDGAFDRGTFRHPVLGPSFARLFSGALAGGGADSSHRTLKPVDPARLEDLFRAMFPLSGGVSHTVAA